MNNKGFAVTTLIYGLAILVFILISIIMTILSSMRGNIKEMATQVEEELLSKSKSNKEYTSDSIGHNVYTTAVDGDGLYRIEVWSPPKYDAEGNNPTGTYVTGVIRLEENRKLYMYREKADSSNPSTNAGTYILAVDSVGSSQYDYSYYYSGSTFEGNYDKNFDKRKTILYADGNGGKLLGGTNDESRQLSYEYNTKYNGNGYMLQYRFVNTKVIKNIPYDDKIGSRGKVNISRILPSKVYSPYKTKNENHWSTQGTIIDIKGDYNATQPCILYISHARITPCFNIGYNLENSEQYPSSNYTKACQNGPNPVTFPFGTGIDGYSDREHIDDLSLICPQGYENLDIEIYLRSSPKKNATSHNYYTRVYNGKYKHHNGEGIKLSQYQPDSIADRIDTGNFYLLNYGTEQYALTLNSDGNSVSMKGFSGLNSQKWEISKFNNFNLTNNTLSNEENNYFDTEREGDLIDKTFKIIDLSTFKALDIRYDENIEGNEVSAQYTFNPISYSEPQIWRLIPNQDGSYSIKTIVKSSNGNENDGYLTYKISNDGSGKNIGDVYISSMKNGILNDNQKFTLFLYDYNNLEEKEN